MRAGLIGEKGRDSEGGVIACAQGDSERVTEAIDLVTDPSRHLRSRRPLYASRPMRRETLGRRRAVEIRGGHRSSRQ